MNSVIDAALFYERLSSPDRAPDFFNGKLMMKDLRIINFQSRLDW